MKHEKVHMIHEDTYIRHIQEKVQLYSMVRQLSHMVRNLPSNRGNGELTRLAAVFEKKSEELFKSWNIPGSYLIFGNETDLAYLMNMELASPENAGYVLCDGECECDDKEKAGSFANYCEAPVSENAGELPVLLSEMIRMVLGDNIIVHVFPA